MNAPFYDIMGSSVKIWFSNGCCCIAGMALRRARFLSLFRFVGGGLVSFLETSLLRVC